MKRVLGLVLLLIIGLANAAYSQALIKPKPAKKKAAEKVAISQEEKLPAIENFDPENLKGKWAVGGTILYLSYPWYGNLENLSARKWIENNSALDFYAGVSYETQLGVDFNNNWVTIPKYAFDLGVGLRQIVARPVENVHIEVIQRLLFTSSYWEYAGSTYDEVHGSQKFDLYLGIGFEAFMPFWKNLSLEGDVGIDAAITYYDNRTKFPTGPDNLVSYWETSISTQNNNVGIVNLAVNYYF